MSRRLETAVPHLSLIPPMRHSAQTRGFAGKFVALTYQQIK
jgi:hypothetical protein